MKPSERPDDPLSLFLATGGERVLRLTVWILFGMLLLSTVVVYRESGQAATLVNLPFLIAGVVTLRLLARRAYRAAFAVFLWSSAGISIGAALLVAGFQTPVLYLTPMMVMLGCWLLPLRQAMPMILASIVGYGGIAVLQSHNMLPAGSRSPVIWAIALTTMTLISSLLIIFMARSVRQQFGAAHELSVELSQLNLDLEDRIHARTAELEATVQRLRETQDDLIQAEKLASLGSMVAGIAHELNTPIGNAMTVVSTLREKAQQLNQSVAGGTVKRSELVGGLSSMESMAELVERSVHRSAALVASFKQVAIDQVSERRRVFDLRQVAEENLDALRPGLRSQPWKIENDIPNGIECDSFPGPLGQVLTNLIQNAVFHGFAGREQGSISISASIDDKWVTLTVADDGVGMDTVTTLRMFEPFFTTKLGKGGSGLGLAVSFRIVTTILGGDIRAQSSPGTGTQMVVRFPRRAPGVL